MIAIYCVHLARVPRVVVVVVVVNALFVAVELVGSELQTLARASLFEVTRRNRMAVLLPVFGAIYAKCNADANDAPLRRAVLIFSSM